MYGDEIGPNTNNDHGAVFNVSGKSDSIAATLMVSSESTISAMGALKARLEAPLYNNIQQFGFPDGENDARIEADVSGLIRLVMVGDAIGDSSVQGCFKRHSPKLEAYNIIAGTNCVTFNTVPQLDTRYDAAISLDRENRRVVLSFNGEKRTIELPDATLFELYRDGPWVAAEAGQREDIAVVHFYTVSNDTVTNDFTISGPPDIETYGVPFDGDYFRDIRIENEQVKLTISSDRDCRTLALSWEGNTDFLEATMSVSSESMVSESSTAVAGLAGELFNTLQDGGYRW